MRQRMQQLRDTWSQLGPAQVLFVAFLCLAMAFAAQQSLDRRMGKTAALLTYGIAAIAFALLMRRTGIEAGSGEADATEGPPPSPATLAATLGLSLLGCLDFGGNQFRPLGLALWIGGLVLTLLYLWLISPAETRGQHLKEWSRSKKLWIPGHWLMLAAILLIGTWFRFRLLNEIPADLGPDLIHHYYDTLDILEGKWRIYFPERESLIFYWTALCARVVGLTQFTLHLASALVGMATVVALYLLGQEAFNRQVALLAALLLAINRWHITLSRSGYPAVFTPLFTTLVLYTLIRALRRRQFIDFAWSGIVLGLGFYTYTPFKSLPLVIIVGLTLYVSTRRWIELRSLLPRLLVMALVALIVLAPMARFAIERPKEYFVRELVALRLKREQVEPSPGLLTYYWRSVLGLNYQGDGTSRWNVPGARQMGFVSGMLMTLGLGYALWRWRKGYNAFLLCAWFMLILPAALGMLPRDAPNSLRMSGTLAPAVLLAALPLPLISQRVQQVRSRNEFAAAKPTLPPEDAAAKEGFRVSLTVKTATRHYAWSWQPQRMNILRWMLILTAILLLAFEAREANCFYFHDFVAWAPDRANYSNDREIAREIEFYGDLESVYVKVWPFWFDSSALRVHLRLTDRSWNPGIAVLAPDQPPLSTLQGPALFIVHPDDQEALATLRQFSPRGVALPRYYPDGTVSFYAYYAEK